MDIPAEFFDIGEKMHFKVIHKDKNTFARCARMSTPHGRVDTPVFMPVATQASVKTLSSEDLEVCGVEMIISNAYHLYLRPGRELFDRIGSLHELMKWPKPITTDSGGFQVFSLADLRKITKDGVHFQSHIDGSKHFFSPEKVIDLQVVLGSDIMMPLDECVKYPATRDYVEESVRLTLDWAKRSKKHFDSKPIYSSLFGIVQGGTYRDLRKECVEELTALDFDGYALGGIGVGEPTELINEITEYTAKLLPEEKPRYLMGVGRPPDVLEAVSNGIDMFDCVVPTRNARNGQAFTFGGELQLRNATFKYDDGVIEAGCCCPVCKAGYSRAYLRHLINSSEILASRFVTLHNIYFYVKLIKLSREAIKEGRFGAFRKDFMEEYSKRKK